MIIIFRPSYYFERFTSYCNDGTFFISLLFILRFSSLFIIFLKLLEFYIELGGRNLKELNDKFD